MTAPTDHHKHDDGLSELVRFLCEHLVGLTWYQGITNHKGEFVAKPKWQAASAFVVELHDRCWLTTAGHVFTDVAKEKRKNSNFGIRDTKIWDGWNDPPDTHVGIPFDFFDDDVLRAELAYHEKGIDLALIPLRGNLFDLLSRTTLPFPRGHWLNSHEQDYYAYYIVGVPTCLADEQHTKTEKGNVVTDEFCPFIVPVTQIDASEVTATEYDQFVAKIDPAWNIESVVGMSGGVILGFHKDKDGKLHYRPVAVQSRWIEKRRIVIGTYLSPCLEAFEQVLRDPEGHAARLSGTQDTATDRA
jgi:hypothetical protein